jgi:hypothetical protein
MNKGYQYKLTIKSWKMKKIILLFLFVNTYLLSYNQILKGTIYAQDTKDVIISASVYFNGTSVGVLTDQAGKFQLDISNYRSMPLTISAIGYYSVSQKDFSSDKPMTIYLKPKVFELNEVVVREKSHARERRENLTIFRNEFLGTTSNSLRCDILNEKDIRFISDNDNDTIKAFAINPILINNKALGYKITYYLDKFEYNKRNASFFFEGNVTFTKDSTIDYKDEKILERKRESAYRGSRMHFFRSLWVDDLKSAGFTVKNSANQTISYKKIVFQKELHTKYLKCPGGLGISYFTLKPTSFIVFLKDEILFDAKGYYDASGIIWEGEMARQRIADLLPLDYSTQE